jgi:hypothetical protein
MAIQRRNPDGDPGPLQTCRVILPGQRVWVAPLQLVGAVLQARVAKRVRYEVQWRAGDVERSGWFGEDEVRAPAPDEVKAPCRS